MSRSTAPVTDSVWLWIAVFSFGALGALTLSIPKYRWRQAQLEHQYEARVASGQATDVFAKGTEGGTEGTLSDPRSETDPDGTPRPNQSQRISLRPLFLLLSLAIFLATGVFWYRRLRTGG